MREGRGEDGASLSSLEDILTETGEATRSNATEHEWPQPISRIALGFRHALVVAGGRVMTFGWVSLGFFTECARRVPTEIPGVSGVVDACAGRTHSVVLLESGRVLSWHDVEEAGVTFKTPSEILPLGAEGESDGDWGGGKVVGVTCGDGFSASWTNDGRLYVWSADIALLRNEQMSPRLPFLPPEPSDRKQWFRPMPVHPSLFQNEKVKAAFAGGEGLLVLTENRKKTYLCRPDDPQCLSFGLPEDMHIPSENASAAFGSDFFLIVLQNQTDSLRQLFAGSVPPPGNPEAGLSFHAIAVGEGRTNVTEVTAGMKFGLARLHNGDVVRAGVDITGKWSGVENSPTLFPQTLEAIGYDALKGKVRLLPKSFYLSGGSIFLTDDGLKGAGFWPGPWWNALLSDQDPMWRGLGVFKKKYPPRLAKGRWCRIPQGSGAIRQPKVNWGFPLRARGVKTSCRVFREKGNHYVSLPDREVMVEDGDVVQFSCPLDEVGGVLHPSSATRSDGSVCVERNIGRGRDSHLEAVFDPPLDVVECRGCKVPIEWQGNYTNPSEATSLPVRILQYQSTASSDNRRWLDFPPEGAGVPLHRKVRLGCRGLISEHESLCIQTERRNSSTFQDRAEYVPEFVDLPSEISCAGCVVPSLWTNKEPPSPSLPFSLELKRGDDPNGTFTEYDKDTPAGAGDLLRLGCRGVLGASSDGDLRRAAEGIECRLKEEDGVRGIDWEIPSENSTAFTCTGCVVPAAWIPNPNSERLRYYVDVKGVVEAGSKKRKALDKTKGIGPVGVNDTIVFSCPNGGVPTRKRARCVVGGDGSPLFDAEVADVQCVPGRSERLMQLLPWVIVLVIISFGTVCYFPYATKKERRRRKMARQQAVSVKPPGGANVEDIQKERPVNIAARETGVKKWNKYN